MDDPTTQRESLSRKEEAEARKADAEAKAAEARAERSHAEARERNAAAALTELTLAEKRREREEALAGDKYHHVYQFNSAVGSSSADRCMGQLMEWVRLAPGEKLDIEIIFHSPGGEVVSGMALFDFIRMLGKQGHHITTMTLGMAASMAGILLQAGTTRAMGREAWVLIHEAQFGAIGTTGQVEDTVEWVKMIHKRILNIFAERSNLTVRQLERRWRRKDWWLSSDDCLKFGLVDEVR